MKKVLISLVLSLLIIISSYAEDDTQILDELDKKAANELQFDFTLKKFSSCQDMEQVMGDYIKEYWKKNKGRWGGPTPYIRGGMFMEDTVTTVDQDESISLKSSSKTVSSSNEEGKDYSETNTQVKGVDESDIIKTDGKYVYYYNDKDKYIYVLNAYPTSKLEVIKKIKLPSNFFSPVMYLDDDRLVILASGYSNYNYGSRYWVNRNLKTYTIIYDTSDINKLELLKLSISDGNFSKSRKIGDYLYTISTNHFNIPYYGFKEIDNVVVESGKIVPKKLEISKTDNENDQNLTYKGKEYPFNVKAGNVAKCNEIEYMLPDTETLEKFDFSPSYNIITITNIRNTEKASKTKVIAGSNAEVYMSHQNLFMTSHMYQSYDFSCGARSFCIMPYYRRGENTLVHKLSIEDDTLNYQDSAIVPGQPLTQYSMDEHDDHFRIITKRWTPERETGVYVLDADMKLVGSLTGLGKTEDFKSSRYMGDKLYLVTFQQIDPFFVIDMSDHTKPTVLGELKIPGYSTYLHPYDDNHIIGLGYDTIEDNGRMRNGGIKLDLYEIAYDKKSKNYIDYYGDDKEADFTCDEGYKYFSDDIGEGCEDPNNKGIYIAQKYSLAFGDNGSYSEALNNPRMFMWNANKNLLLLPATLYKTDPKEYYKRVDFYNGMLAVNIHKDTGISEKWRVSHLNTTGIETERQKQCEKYAISNDEPECYEIIGGGTHCPQKNRYVPSYCYKDSPIGEYLANRSYKYSNSFIKRALWIEDGVYTLSNDKMGVNGILSGNYINDVKMK